MSKRANQVGPFYYELKSQLKTKVYLVNMNEHALQI